MRYYSDMYQLIEAIVQLEEDLGNSLFLPAQQTASRTPIATQLPRNTGPRGPPLREQQGRPGMLRCFACGGPHLRRECPGGETLGNAGRASGSGVARPSETRPNT